MEAGGGNTAETTRISVARATAATVSACPTVLASREPIRTRARQLPKVRREPAGPRIRRAAVVVKLVARRVGVRGPSARLRGQQRAPRCLGPGHIILTIGSLCPGASRPGERGPRASPQIVEFGPMRVVHGKRSGRMRSGNWRAQYRTLLVSGALASGRACVQARRRGRARIASLDPLVRLT